MKVKLHSELPDVEIASSGEFGQAEVSPLEFNATRGAHNLMVCGVYVTGRGVAGQSVQGLLCVDLVGEAFSHFELVPELFRFVPGGAL